MSVNKIKMTQPTSVESIGWVCLYRDGMVIKMTQPTSVASIGWVCLSRDCMVIKMTQPTSVESIGCVSLYRDCMVNTVEYWTLAIGASLFAIVCLLHHFQQYRNVMESIVCMNTSFTTFIIIIERSCMCRHTTKGQ